METNNDVVDGANDNIHKCNVCDDKDGEDDVETSNYEEKEHSVEEESEEQENGDDLPSL